MDDYDKAKLLAINSFISDNWYLTNKVQTPKEVIRTRAIRVIDRVCLRLALWKLLPISQDYEAKILKVSGGYCIVLHPKDQGQVVVWANGIILWEHLGQESRDLIDQAMLLEIPPETFPDFTGLNLRQELVDNFPDVNFSFLN